MQADQVACLISAVSQSATMNVPGTDRTDDAYVSENQGWQVGRVEETCKCLPRIKKSATRESGTG